MNKLGITVALILTCGVAFAYENANEAHSKASAERIKVESGQEAMLEAIINGSINREAEEGNYDVVINVEAFSPGVVEEQAIRLMNAGYSVTTSSYQYSLFYIPNTYRGIQIKW